MLTVEQSEMLGRFEELSGSDARGIPLDDLRVLGVVLGVDVSSFGRKKLELLRAVLLAAKNLSGELMENRPQEAPERPQKAEEDEIGVVGGEGAKKAVKTVKARSKKKAEERDFYQWVNCDTKNMSPWSKGQKVLFRVGGDEIDGVKNDEWGAEIGEVRWTVHSSETNELIGLGLLREDGTTITIKPEWSKTEFATPAKKKRKKKTKE